MPGIWQSQLGWRADRNMEASTNFSACGAIIAKSGESVVDWYVQLGAANFRRRSLPGFDCVTTLNLEMCRSRMSVS